MGFQGLLLDEGLEADMTLKGPDTGMDQHVPPQVCRQRELARTYITLEALRSLRINRKKQRLVRMMYNRCQSESTHHSPHVNNHFFLAWVML